MQAGGRCNFVKNIIFHDWIISIPVIYSAHGTPCITNIYCFNFNI